VSAARTAQFKQFDNGYQKVDSESTGNKKGLGELPKAFGIWSWRWESNPRPADYKSAALPTELHQRMNVIIQRFIILPSVF
jgi:hypothetical protein